MEVGPGRYGVPRTHPLMDETWSGLRGPGVGVGRLKKQEHLGEEREQ